MLYLRFPASCLLGVLLLLLGGAEGLEAATGHPGFGLLVGHSGQVSHPGSLGAETLHYESITAPKFEDLVPSYCPAICSTPIVATPVWGPSLPGPADAASSDSHFTFS